MWSYSVCVARSGVSGDRALFGARELAGGKQGMKAVAKAEPKEAVGGEVNYLAHLRNCFHLIMWVYRFLYQLMSSLRSHLLQMQNGLCFSVSRAVKLVGCDTTKTNV